jgi:hypothetical protein
VRRFASVRFDGVLGADEREAVARAYSSAGTTVTSWATSGTRSYATLAFAADARNVPPPLLVLRVIPEATRLLETLRAAFAGPGRPAGVAEAYRDGRGVVIEFDPRRSSLALVVALIDAELATAPGRAIQTLVPLDDVSLTAYAGIVLGIPALTPAHLIETYLEPLIAASRA